jgi:hypothetical protein
LSASLLVSVIGVRSSSAEPLQIADGYMFLSYHSFGLDMGLVGDEFHYLGETDVRFIEDLLCTTCSPVRTNSPFRLRFSRAQLTDPSTNSSCPGCEYEGDFTFRAPSLVFTPNGSVVPFAVEGNLAGYFPGAADSVFRHNLVGTGMLRVGVLQDRPFALFDFAASPIPEPTSVLLLATGLLGVLLRARCAGTGGHGDGAAERVTSGRIAWSAVRARLRLQ